MGQTASEEKKGATDAGDATAQVGIADGPKELEQSWLSGFSWAQKVHTPHFSTDNLIFQILRPSAYMQGFMCCAPCYETISCSWLALVLCLQNACTLVP